MGDQSKPLYWMRSSKRDLKTFPDDVQDVMGYALFLAQAGDRHGAAKQMKGLGAGVVEIIDSYDGDAYRAVYTVHFKKAVYMLHAFQKKSKRGIATPKADIDLIKSRLKRC